MYDQVQTAVYLEWSGSQSGVVVCGEGKRSRPVKVSEVPATIKSNPDIVVVRHLDGPGLANAALSAVQAGRAKSALIESDFGIRTELTGTAVKTLTTWTSHNPNNHPTAKILPYTTGDPAALATVVGNLFDPKWYLDYERPERRSAAECRMGLTPRWDGKDSIFRKCLTRAWFPSSPIVDESNFFGRMYTKKCRECKSTSVAERIVGRYFLKCVLAAWDDADRPIGAEPMFDPGLMFGKR